MLLYAQKSVVYVQIRGVDLFLITGFETVILQFIQSVYVLNQSLH